MFAQFRTTLIKTVILSFALIVAISIAWATTTYYSASDVIGDAGGSIKINDNANVLIKAGALSAYLGEQQINEVLITVDLEEILDAEGNLDTLVFTFGPSGAYFDPELELQFKKEYVVEGIQIYNENGEAIEYTVKAGGKKVNFLIPHFSTYSYDLYDEY